MFFKRILFVAAAVSMPAGGAVAIKPATGPSKEPYFVPLTSLRVPIIDGSTVTGSLTVDLVLDAVDQPGATRLRADFPRLRAASVAATAEFARLYPSGLTPVDAGELSAGVSRALAQASPDVARVLIVKVAASSA